MLVEGVDDGVERRVVDPPQIDAGDARPNRGWIRSIEIAMGSNSYRCAR